MELIRPKLRQSYFLILAGLFALAGCGKPMASSSQSTSNSDLSSEEGQHTVSCDFNGQNVADGASVTAYQSAAVPFGQTCMSQTRTCNNGTLSGSYTFAACTVQPAANCTFNGQTVNNGASVTAYQSSSVPAGQTCAMQTRTCSNGTLSGSYTFASCTVQAANGSCTLNGVTVANGLYIIAYQSQTVPDGQTCKFEPRTCTNGVLSGSYAFATCTATSPQTPPVTSLSVTGNSYVDGLLAGTKWAVQALSYSFPTSGSVFTFEAPDTMYGGGENNQGFTPFSALQQNATTALYKNYSNVSGLTFGQQTETDTSHATMRYAMSSLPYTAWGYFPSTKTRGGDSWFNTTNHWYDNPGKGNYANNSIQHEMGHALGLKHPSDGGTTIYTLMPLDRDSLEYSIMSYRSYIGGGTGALTLGGWSYPQTLMVYDIQAIQYLYGANYSYNSGDTVYKWSSTTGEMFINGVGQGAPGGNKILMALWDGGGKDTYDFSNYNVNLSVDIRPGNWTKLASAQVSDLGGGHVAAGNISSAFLYQNNPASLIENVVGGSAADTIIANAANNIITGGAGNDVIDGMEGSNVSIYSGLKANYAVTQNPNGTITVADQRAGAPDGTDTLTHIQVLRFTDGDVQGSPPMENAPEQFFAKVMSAANTPLVDAKPGDSEISEWSNCQAKARPGYVFEVENAHGQTMLTHCSAKALSQIPVEWVSAPVRFRVVREPASEHSTQGPGPSQ